MQDKLEFKNQIQIYRKSIIDLFGDAHEHLLEIEIRLRNML